MSNAGLKRKRLSPEELCRQLINEARLLCRECIAIFPVLHDWKYVKCFDSMELMSQLDNRLTELKTGGICANKYGGWGCIYNSAFDDERRYLENARFTVEQIIECPFKLKPEWSDVEMLAHLCSELTWAKEQLRVLASEFTEEFPQSS